MGKSYRTSRIGVEIQRVVSDMLMNEIKDPRLSERMISITGVDVTNDGSYATCYFTVLSPSGNISNLNDEDNPEEENDKKEVLEGLNSASGLIRREVGRRIKMRHVPNLIFKPDTSMEYGRHIENVIRELEKTDE